LILGALEDRSARGVHLDWTTTAAQIIRPSVAEEPSREEILEDRKNMLISNIWTRQP